MSQAQVRPWELVQQEINAQGTNAADWFRDIQRRGAQVSGLILVAWQARDNEEPSLYLKDLEPEVGWAEFADDTSEQRPMIYRSLRGALVRIQKETKLFPQYKIGFAWWEHPEADYQPSDRYTAMTGVVFPRCPRS